MSGVSPEVRSRASSPERDVNTDSASTVTRMQGSLTSLNYSLDNPDANSMVGEDIRLPAFNGNGEEDQEQHWFLCEAVWMVFQFNSANLRKEHMITTLRGFMLDWFMKFCIVGIRNP